MAMPGGTGPRPPTGSRTSAPRTEDRAEAQAAERGGEFAGVRTTRPHAGASDMRTGRPHSGKLSRPGHVASAHEGADRLSSLDGARTPQQDGGGSLRK